MLAHYTQWRSQLMLSLHLDTPQLARTFTFLSSTRSQPYNPRSSNRPRD